MTKGKPITAAEHAALRQKNPEWVARQAKLEAQLKEYEEQSRREQVQLLADLKTFDIHTDTVWNFVNTADKYPAAIPVLLHHLSLPYSAGTKEGIVRALTVSYAGPDVLRELIKQFCEQSDDGPASLKWVLGNAISEVARPSDAEAMIRLATDPSHGEARDMITQRLPRVVKDKARLREVLDYLMRDRQMEPYARRASQGRLY